MEDLAILRDKTLLSRVFLCTQGMYKVSVDRFGRVHRPTCSSVWYHEPLLSYALNEYREIEYPENHKFACTMTHDIDSLFPSWKYMIYKGLTDKEFVRCILKARRRTYFSVFKEIIELEESSDARSSVYFLIGTDLSGRQPSFSQLKSLQDIIDLLLDHEIEIGLHTSHYRNADLQSIIEEKGILEKLVNRSVGGVRTHYLRFMEPETWQVLHKAGFHYDTTYAFPDNVGFRNGLCHPFRPFDLKNLESIQIWELPLIFSDSAVMGYLKLGPRETWERFVELLHRVKKAHGVLNIVLHPATFDLYYFTWRRFCKLLLQKLKSEGSWITSAGKLIDYWDKNYGKEDISRILDLGLTQSFDC